MSTRKWFTIGEFVMNKRDKVTKMKRFQGLNWTPKAIPVNRIIESKKRKNRQQYKIECRKLTAAYENQDNW